jgi:hypothetical protein
MGVYKQGHVTAIGGETSTVVPSFSRMSTCAPNLSQEPDATPVNAV